MAILRFDVCDGYDGDRCATIRQAAHGRHDNARSVFRALGSAGEMFLTPKICVGDDQTGLRFGNRHALFCVQQRVQVVVLRSHFGGFDGRDFVGRQLRD